MFFSPFSIAITSLGEERANLSAFRVCSICVCLVLSVPLPLGVWERFVIVALPGLLSYLCLYACNDFSTQFRKTFLRYIKIGYNINAIRQTACMVVNPITVNNIASLLGCIPACRASDSMTAPV